MKLPNREQAVAPEEKITRYLLSPTHPDGMAKAAFFLRFGFSLETWQDLRTALLVHAADNTVAGEEETPFGTRYVVDGILRAPDGRHPEIRSVWFIASGDSVPRLVTAYPLQRRRR